ncbi:hypothetical protein RYH80_03990 [Halobaculum sp. MBLA0147]|uniref:hypothetical protein n=1 Tax=Halobaculum sp. MBLA0147 TaxID=3079934 RepID=UPI0035253B45
MTDSESDSEATDRDASEGVAATVDADVGDDERRDGASAGDADASDGVPAMGVDPSEVSVPTDAETHTCEHCGRVFARARHRDLHRGRAHRDLVDDAEAAAYRSAAESEWDELRRYRYLALGTLVLLYFGFLVVYAVAGTG